LRKDCIGKGLTKLRTETGPIFAIKYNNMHIVCQQIGPLTHNGNFDKS